MDDMRAFEQRVAGEVIRVMGPSEPVDDHAIFNDITAVTRSSKWRFQSLFSATRFVAAALIVALFGGFLLAGVLTQPTEELAPAAASPSTPTSDDLLSSFDAEEVAPGVFRVFSDGYHGLDTDVGQIAVTPEGDIWALKYGQDMAIRIVRVGAPGVAYRLDESTGAKAFSRLVTGDDGTIGHAQWIHDVPAVLEGREWISHDGSRYENCVRLFGSVAADGTCFENEPRSSGLMQVTEDETRFVPARDVGSFGYDAPINLSDIRFGKPVAADGIVWATAYSDDGGTSELAIVFEGLAKYDGQSWSSIPYPKGRALHLAGLLSVTPDGVVWVDSYVDGEGLSMVSWDGEQWHSYGPVAVPRASADAHVHQDGTITFGVMASFDGTSLTRLDLPDGVIRDMSPLTFAPDGSAWAVGNGGLYVFTPEAITVAESEPGSASPREGSRQGLAPSPAGPRSSG